MNSDLIAAAKAGDLPAVKYLVETLGADVHAGKDAALIDASDLGHIEIVKFLLDKGADVHNGEALLMAARRRHFEIVRLFLDSGADLHINDEEILMHATSRGNLEMFKYLVERGAVIHAQNNQALEMAVMFGDYETVEYLIMHIDKTHAMNIEPLILSYTNKRYDITRLLLDIFVKNKKYNGITFTSSIILGDLNYTKIHFKYNIGYATHRVCRDITLKISKFIIRNTKDPSDLHNYFYTHHAVYKQCAAYNRTNKSRKLRRQCKIE